MGFLLFWRVYLLFFAKLEEKKRHEGPKQGGGQVALWQKFLSKGKILSCSLVRVTHGALVTGGTGEGSY